MSVVYLDHAATTAIRESVIEQMARVMRETGNASSLHTAGRRARQEVEQAREQIADVVGADPVEVIFTSGATEADNLAIKGGWWSAQAGDRARSALAVSAAEHHAVLDPARWLADHEQATLRWIDVDADGAVRLDAVSAALEHGDVAIMATMWANNEVGVINDVAAVVHQAADHTVPVHIDAVQALGRVAIDFRALGASSMALSAHKVGGPQGIGALVATRTFTPTPIAHGGGQERQVRSGTLDVAGAVGMGVAVAAAEAERAAECARLGQLRSRLLELTAVIPDAALNGSPNLDRSVPGIVNLWLPGADADAVLMLLDTQHIAISTGSACTAGVSEPSHVVLAMTGDEQRARQSIRISLGRTSTPADVDALARALPIAVEQARRATGYRSERG